MTCVCSVGLDMIVVPGSTSVETIFTQPMRLQLEPEQQNHSCKNNSGTRQKVEIS